MNIIINEYDYKNYNLHKQIHFKAKIQKDLISKEIMADSQFLSQKYDVTIGEFKRVYLDTTLSLRQKSKILNVAATTLRNWAKKLGIKPEISKNTVKNITKEMFDEVYRLDIPEKEKYEMLGINHKFYYKKMLEFGYVPMRTAKKKEVAGISRETFEQVFFDESLTEQEKHKKLKLSAHTYLKKAKDFGLRTVKTDNDERIASISKAEFDRVFFDKHLNTEHKLKILGINHSTFIKYARKYGYKTDMQLRLEYLKSITKELFDSLFYNKNLSLQEKQERLKIDSRLYRLFAVKFGHANEITDDLSITIQEFDKVFFDNNLSTKEKIKKLNVSRDDYYYLIAKFGYQTERQKQSKYIDKISKETFLEVANDANLSEEEKYNKLKISHKTFFKLSKKYGYKSERTEQKEYINSITKEEFDKIFFDENLSEKEKHENLYISAFTYRDKAQDYDYRTNAQQAIRNVADITSEKFDNVYKDANLSTEGKCKKLNISKATYQRLLRVFGYIK